MNLLKIAVAPVVAVCIYIFVRDKYEKEPIALVLTGLLYGVIITAPIVFVENIIAGGNTAVGLKHALYTSFLVASLVEEGFKYLILYFLIWRNKEFNEKMDGIVYAVFISIGFAGVENLLYVFNPVLGGVKTAIGRAILSVPGHALFGVSMGYYFARAKFEKENKLRFMLLAFTVPFLLHGIYDTILLAKLPYYFPIFLCFIVYLWRSGLSKIKKHIQSSPFK